MTETNAALWDAVDLEINDWLGDGNDAYCLTDMIVGEMQEKWTASRLVNMIGLKRRIGKALKARGYTKTSSSPPTWVLHPAVVHIVPEVPQYVIDTYLSLLQAQAVIEKQFPGIEAAVAL